MASFLKIDVFTACQAHGPKLNVPDGIDPVRLMMAMASVESSMGANCGPRHEPAYDVGGAVYRMSPVQRALVAKYPGPATFLTVETQSPAACSYGPWQLMLVNCNGATPTDLLTDLDLCADCFVSQFNAYVEGARHASTLAEIGEVWNLGHVGPDPDYVAKLTAAYGADGE